MLRRMIAQSVGAFPLLIRGALAHWLSVTCSPFGRRHLLNSCQPMNRLVPRTITGWRSLANKLRLPSRLGEMQAATSEGRHWCLLVWSGRTISGLPVPDSHPTRFTSRATRALRRGNHSDTLLNPQILRVTLCGSLWIPASAGMTRCSGARSEVCGWLGTGFGMQGQWPLPAGGFFFLALGFAAGPPPAPSAGGRGE